MAKRWERSDAIVAQRINASQIGGFPSKKIKLLEYEEAFIEKDGEILESLSAGTHKVAGMFSGSGREVAFVDRNPKFVRREVKKLWTKDDRQASAAVELRFSVKEPEKIRKVMLARKDIVTIEDVWAELEKEVKSSVLAPIAKKKKMDDLQSKRETVKEMQVAAEVELKKKFEVFGLDLVSFDVSFMPPEEYQEYLRKRGVLKEEAEMEEAREDEETREAVHDKDIDETEGKIETRDKVTEDMQKERIRRESEMNIEEEENQQDMKDALEALKLKEVNDKQKMLKDSERKELGLESLKELPGENKGKLEEKYKDLQNMMGATEKKYLERKIDKDTFRKIMENMETEKTKMEVKMKKEK